MRPLRNIKWLPVLMALSIMAIIAFQLYWLRKAYQREEIGLERQTNMLFRETVRGLQATKLKLDRILDTNVVSRISLKGDSIGRPRHFRNVDPKMGGMIDVMM